MADQKFLFTMYQQWCAGNADYNTRWDDFVKMASKNQGVDFETMKPELKKYNWFKCTE